MSTTTQDDELLIIQDESDTSNDSLSFNIDFDDDTNASKEEDTVESEVKSDNWTDETFEIQLDDTTQEAQNKEQSSDIKNEINNATTNTSQAETSSDTDIGIGLDAANTDTNTDSSWKSLWDNSSVAEEVWFEISLWDDTATTELKDDLSDMNTGTSNDSSSEQDDSLNMLWDSVVSVANESIPEQTPSSENLNDILTATITKLTLRKDAIHDDTSSKQAKVQDLKAQIEKLENQVSEIEAEITSLWLESDKIDTNITQLENMKLDPVKEHNAKRVSKK